MTKKKSKTKTETQVSAPVETPDVDFDTTPKQEESEEYCPTAAGTTETNVSVTTTSSDSPKTVQATETKPKKRAKRVAEKMEKEQLEKVIDAAFDALPEDVQQRAKEMNPEIEQNKYLFDNGTELVSTEKPLEKSKRGVPLSHLAAGTRFRILHTEVEGTLVEVFAGGDAKIKQKGKPDPIMIYRDTEVLVIKDQEEISEKKKKKDSVQPAMAYNTEVMSSECEGNNQSGEAIMQVSKSEIVGILVNRGFKAVKATSKLTQLQRIVDNNLTDFTDADPWLDGTTPEQKERFSKITRLLSKGKPVEVIEDKSETNGEATHAEANGTTPTKEKPVKKAAKDKNPDKSAKTKKTNGESKRGAKLFGQSAGAVLRWMGWKGFKRDAAKKVCDKFGAASISDSTLVTYLADGRREDEKYGKRASLKKEEQQEILAFLEK